MIMDVKCLISELGAKLAQNVSAARGLNKCPYRLFLTKEIQRLALTYQNGSGESYPFAYLDVENADMD